MKRMIDKIKEKAKETAIVNFDYFKPDFSIVKETLMVHVRVPQEVQFYLKHRIIYLLNQVNDNYDQKINFDNISVARYMVTRQKSVLITVNISNMLGTLHFKYNKDQLIGYFFSLNDEIYSNNILPNTQSLFDVDIEIDKDFNLMHYKLHRSISTEEFDFDPDNVVIMYHIKSLDKTDLVEKSIKFDFGDEEHEIKMKEPLNDFDEFFNEIAYDFFKHTEIFVELYPQLGTIDIRTQKGIEHAYSKLQELYKAEVFKQGLADVLVVIKMNTI